MLIPILIALLAVVFWTSYVVVYFWKEIYGWLDNRWGPQSRPEKTKIKRRLYD